MDWTASVFLEWILMVYMDWGHLRMICLVQNQREWNRWRLSCAWYHQCQFPGECEWFVCRWLNYSTLSTAVDCEMVWTWDFGVVWWVPCNRTVRRGVEGGVWIGNGLSGDGNGGALTMGSFEWRFLGRFMELYVISWSGWNPLKMLRCVLWSFGLILRSRSNVVVMAMCLKGCGQVLYSRWEVWRHTKLLTKCDVYT